MRRHFLPLATAVLFAGVLACALAPLARAQSGPVPGIPYIDHAVAHPDTDGGSWSLALQGHFPDSIGCWTVGRMAREGYALLLSRPDSCATPTSGRWRWRFALGQLRPGHHSIFLTLGVDEHPDDSVPPVLHQGVFEFDVPRDTIPPPPAVPFVDSILVASASRPDSICAGDSLLVKVSGVFPNGCYFVRGVELVPTPIPEDRPAVRVVVDRGTCRFCDDEPQPWAASIVLPPRAPGRHSQPVVVDVVDCGLGDSLLVHFATRVPFTVSDCGPPPLSCLLADFLGPERGGECDAFVAPGDPADLTFGVLTFRDLAGLQGSFTLHPSGLRIANIETVGAASSMRLDWVRTTTGARFTLFAESGAPIAGCPDLGLCLPQPLLRITVSADSTPPPLTTLAFHDLLGSTIDGIGVPECPVAYLDDPRFAFPGARICAAGAECDFNADGRSDIRDLVLMVHCVNQTGACPPGGAFDCNGDGNSSLADVICCARHILRRNPSCRDCPPDTLRPAPQVRAALGEAIHSATGVELPLTLIGAEHLGGALLELSFPSDRYEAAAVLSGGASGWLDLHETRDGKLVIGLVRLGPEMTLEVDQRVEIAVRLTLKPGQQPGGTVTCASSEFSGADGAMLAVSLGTLSQPLTGPARLQLSSARPNPTGGETSFALTLDRASHVEVGVFDLGGRRVATLHRGAMTAGEHVLRWDGRGDDGLAAPSGVYFYRADAGGAPASRKLVLMRER